MAGFLFTSMKIVDLDFVMTYSLIMDKTEAGFSREVICAHCGQTFTVYRRKEDARRKFCTPRCRVLAVRAVHKETYKIRRLAPPTNPRRPWVESVCNMCSKPFWTIPSAAKNALNCSKACHSAWMKTHRDQGTCKRCGKPFDFVLRSNRGKQEFCSSYCSRRYRSGSLHPRWRTNRLRKCAQCGKDFPAFVVNKGTGREVISERKFCSAACQIANRRNAPLGSIAYDKAGYRLVKVVTPEGTTDWVQEHRLVVEQHLGRLLERHELIHHRNGVKTDDRIENLLVTTNSEHKKIHAEASLIGLKIMCYTGNWVHPLEGIAV